MTFRLLGYHHLWRRFPTTSTTSHFGNSNVLQPQQASSLVWALPVSLAATQGIEFSFSSCSYLDVSVHCVYRLTAMYSLLRQSSTKMIGFPHSEISGSKRTYRSPKHIGVSPVLHRLLVPRHSPCALHNLTLMILRSPQLLSMRLISLIKLK